MCGWMIDVEWKPYGPDAALVRIVGGAEKVRAVIEWLEGEPVDGLREWSVAFDQVLLEFQPGVAVVERVGDLIEIFEGLREGAEAAARIHRIPVRYDGEDLGLVARGARMSEDEVMRVHSAGEYVVAMLGFSPGFPYLTGLDGRLATPRRTEPRARIRAGAVAIGGTHAGIYTVDSPGGWNVIGYTDVRLFDLAAESFLLRAGDRVEFVA